MATKKEVKVMLNVLKNNSNRHNRYDTLIEGINLESFHFVIDCAIKAIEEVEG